MGGRINTTKVKTTNDKIIGEIEIYYETFKKIVKSLGFEDEKIILSKFKSHGYIDYESGKNYRKRKISPNDAISSRVVVLYLFKDESEKATDNTSERKIMKLPKAN